MPPMPVGNKAAALPRIRCVLHPLPIGPVAPLSIGDDFMRPVAGHDVRRYLDSCRKLFYHVGQ